MNTDIITVTVALGISAASLLVFFLAKPSVRSSEEMPKRTRQTPKAKRGPGGTRASTMRRRAEKLKYKIREKGYAVKPSHILQDDFDEFMSVYSDVFVQRPYSAGTRIYFREGVK